MTQWMGDPEMEIEIISDWQVDAPFIVKGFHHFPFENLGKIQQFEAKKTFQYSHLSSLSELPDKPENYTIISFRLQECGEHSTELTVEVENFPTEAIYKHWAFYWNGTVHLLKTLVEKAAS